MDRLAGLGFAINPLDVPANRKNRLGVVGPGMELNQLSQIANSSANLFNQN